MSACRRCSAPYSNTPGGVAVVNVVIFLCIVTLWTWLSAGASRRLALQKGRSPDEGYWLGVVLGGFGLLVEALLPSRMP